MVNYGTPAPAKLTNKGPNDMVAKAHAFVGDLKANAVIQDRIGYRGM